MYYYIHMCNLLSLFEFVIVQFCVRKFLYDLERTYAVCTYIYIFDSSIVTKLLVI